MKVGIIAPAIYPLGQLDKYGGIERLCSLFLKGLREVAPDWKVGCLCPSGSILPRGVERWDSGSSMVDFNELGNWHWAYSLVNAPYQETWTYLDFSHSKYLGRMAHIRQANQLSIIWHDPKIQTPPQPKYNVVSLSKWQADRFYQTTGQCSLVMDPHCCEDGPTDSGVQLNLPEDFCLFIGKMGPDKGALEAIQACLKIKENLVVIGAVTPGDPPEYVRAVNTLVDGKSIIHLGEASDAVKWYCLRRAKCLVYPASYKPGEGESHSHKSAEAIYAGLPVVALDNGAVREVVQDGVTGVIIPDLAQLADGIARCCQLDRKKVLEVGRKWDYRQVVKNWLPLIERVSQGARW